VMSEKFEDHLFDYPYRGSRWGFTIRAASREDAEARLKALGWAQYSGQLHETIPAMSPRGLFVPLIVWWRNFMARS